MSRPVLSFRLLVPADAGRAACDCTMRLLFHLPVEAARVLDLAEGPARLVVDVTREGDGELVRRRTSGQVLALSDRLLHALPERDTVAAVELGAEVAEDFVDLGEDTLAMGLRAAVLLLEVDGLIRITWRDRMPWCELTDEGRAMRVADRERSARSATPAKNETKGGDPWVH